MQRDTVTQKLRVNAYGSRVTTKTEWNVRGWNALWEIHYGIKHFRSYVYGQKIMVMSRALTCLLRKQELTPRMQKFKLTYVRIQQQQIPIICAPEPILYFVYVIKNIPVTDNILIGSVERDNFCHAQDDYYNVH